MRPITRWESLWPLPIAMNNVHNIPHWDSLLNERLGVSWCQADFAALPSPWLATIARMLSSTAPHTLTPCKLGCMSVDAK